MAVVDTDINKKLNQLVLDFKIDRFNPGFKVMVAAEELIARFKAEHSKKPWVLISRYKEDADFFSRSVNCLEETPVYLYEEINGTVMDQMLEMKNSHEFLIVSFYGWQEMWNNLYNQGITVFSLYDYFMVHNLICTGNYYDVFRRQYYKRQGGKTSFNYLNLDLNSVFFYDRRCYETVESREQKKLYLSKMIFDCVYARDFGMLERCIKEYSTHCYEGYELYEKFLSRVNALITEIKEYVDRRKSKDIVMFWLDALEYGEDSIMPYLGSLADQSLDFENAFTVTPYTHSTAKTLFYGKYVTNDQAFRLRVNAEGRLGQNLKRRGYKIRFYTFLEQVDRDIKADMTQSRYMPLSAVCWNFICDLLSDEQPVFAILHELFHTHLPYISLGVTGSEYFYLDKWDVLQGNEAAALDRQMAESRQAADQVLQFYSGLLSESMYKIYMSDHGHTYMDKYHTIFRVVQKDILPRKVSRMFSYIHFPELIENLLEQNMELPDVLSDFARIQDVDYYYKKYIKYMLCSEEPDLFGLFGYEGICTQEEYYLRFNDGREEFYSNRPGQNIHKERIEYLRSICPPYPQDIIKDEKFEFSRLTYQVLDNYGKRNQEFEDAKKREILNLFESLPENEFLALRGGGVHTYRLWLALPWELKRKINYVVDKKKQCMASKLDMDVILPGEVQKQKIDTIIISSFEYEEEWMKEMEALKPGCRVIGLYSYLKRRGVACARAFYYQEYKQEDLPPMVLEKDV